MAAPYLAPSLLRLRDEINQRWPRRDKRSDGWIGDAAHRARRSEHNPDGKGCVHAIDVDKDGIDVKALLRETIGDPRVWYVIYNRVIYSRTHGWRARRYTGANSHDKHVHVSIMLSDQAERDVASWFAPPPATRASRSAGRASLPAPRTLRRGMRGQDVAFVQRFIGAKLAGPDDGIFGPRTEAAVRWYQRMRGLAVDGLVGPATWAAMGRRS